MCDSRPLWTQWQSGAILPLTVYVGSAPSCFTAFRVRVYINVRTMQPQSETIDIKFIKKSRLTIQSKWRLHLLGGGDELHQKSPTPSPITYSIHALKGHLLTCRSFACTLRLLRLLLLSHWLVIYSLHLCFSYKTILDFLADRFHAIRMSKFPEIASLR